MDIREVLRLPINTKVKCGNEEFIVSATSCNGKGLVNIFGNSYIALSENVINAEYELVRKKLNFFEAMRLVYEGKVVESDSKYIYKKDADGCLACKDNLRKAFKVEDLIVDEILGDWYEVIE